MYRLLGIPLVFLALAPAELLGQGFNPYAPNPPPLDARARRAMWERAVAHVGPSSRGLIETHGDDACAAVFTCSKQVGLRLAEFHSSGGLDKLPRPRDLLRAISQRQNGDDVAHWAIEHAQELGDIDCFDAYLLCPLDYALGLKQLSHGAAEVRSRRMAALAPQPQQPFFSKVSDYFSSIDPRTVTIICVGAGTVGAVLFWRWRKRKNYPMTIWRAQRPAVKQ